MSLARAVVVVLALVIPSCSGLPRASLNVLRRSSRNLARGSHESSLAEVWAQNGPAKYAVQPGDTPYALSKRFNVPVSSLPSSIKGGDEITLNSLTFYTVQAKDTVFSIAKTAVMAVTKQPLGEAVSSLVVMNALCGTKSGPGNYPYEYQSGACAGGSLKTLNPGDKVIVPAGPQQGNSNSGGSGGNSDKGFSCEDYERSQVTARWNSASDKGPLVYTLEALKKMGCKTKAVEASCPAPKPNRDLAAWLDDSHRLGCLPDATHVQLPPVYGIATEPIYTLDPNDFSEEACCVRASRNSYIRDWAEGGRVEERIKACQTYKGTCEAESCFGGVGAGCAGAPGAPRKATGSQIELSVSVGSIRHDSCCVQHPKGQVCGSTSQYGKDFSMREWPLDMLGWDDRCKSSCVAEWRKAVTNNLWGRQWRAKFTSAKQNLCALKSTVSKQGRQTWLWHKGQFLQMSDCKKAAGAEDPVTLKLKAPKLTKLDCPLADPICKAASSPPGLSYPFKKVDYKHSNGVTIKGTLGYSPLGFLKDPGVKLDTPVAAGDSAYCESGKFLGIYQDIAYPPINGHPAALAMVGYHPGPYGLCA